MPSEFNESIEATRAMRKDLEDQEKRLIRLEEKKRAIEVLEAECSAINAKVHDIERELAEREDMPVDTATKKKMELINLQQSKLIAEGKILILKHEAEALSVINDRKKHFDKYLLIQNIRELLKESDIKIGQIEKEAGCQLGYTSRLEKTGNTTDPSVEFIVTASQLLNVSVDSLLFLPIKDLSSQDLYIISLLEKMIRDTAEDKLPWNRESVEKLQQVDINSFGQVGHELFVMGDVRSTSDVKDKKLKYQAYFPSHTFDVASEIAGDCYNVRLKNGTYLYLMYVGYKDTADRSYADECMELWLKKKDEPATYLCGTYDSSKIEGLIEQLYENVEYYCKRPKLSETYRNALDAFMKDDLSDD